MGLYPKGVQRGVLPPSLGAEPEWYDDLMRASKKNKSPSRFKKASLFVAGMGLLSILVLLLLQLPLVFGRIRLSKIESALQILEEERVDLPSLEDLMDIRGAVHVQSRISQDCMGTFDQIVEGARTHGIGFVIMAEQSQETPLKTRQNTFQGVDGDILFIPGVEMESPEGPLLAFGWDKVELSPSDPVATTAQKVKQGGGLLFLCRTPSWEDWNLSADGAELFNLDDDLEDEDLSGFLPRILYSLKRYPFLCFQEFYDFPEESLAMWNQALSQKPFVGIAGNHAKRSIGIRFLKGEKDMVRAMKADGDLLSEAIHPLFAKTLGWLDKDPEDDLVWEFILDTYANSFSYVSTRVLAATSDKEAVMDALERGRCYVCYEALATPQGFRFVGIASDRRFLMGESLSYREGLELELQSPVPCILRLLKDGELVGESQGRGLVHRVDGPGVYRAEAYLRLLDQERLWLLTNPIYVT